MVGFPDVVYDLFMAPFEFFFLRRIRKKLVHSATGTILEIGAGTGANLSYYQHDAVNSLTIIDLEISDKVRNFHFKTGFPVKFIEGTAEKLPFEDESFDTVVFTLVFCSVPDPVRGLQEVYRILKPNGKVYFIEHILPEKKLIDPVVHFITPAWKKIAAGCYLNRKTLDIFKECGFTHTTTRFLSDFFAGGVAEKIV